MWAIQMVIVTHDGRKVVDYMSTRGVYRQPMKTWKTRAAAERNMSIAVPHWPGWTLSVVCTHGQSELCPRGCHREAR
jgi:hypothetical protein